MMQPLQEMAAAVMGPECCVQHACSCRLACINAGEVDATG
jgi:hypothetical protein